MQIDVTTSDGILLAAITGRVDANTAPQMQEELAPLVGPAVRMVIEMEGVQFMSSAGLRTLLLLHRDLEEADGRLVLVGVMDDVRDIMSMTGFLEHFTVCETLDEAYRLLRS
jgi:anti-sigma B factor antagonist